MPTPAPRRPARDFVAPRELEHPVVPLDAADARTLVWVQPMPMRPAYELWAGEAVVGTLRYRSLEHREALGCAAEGMWRFDEAGDPSAPGIVVTERGARVGRFAVDGAEGVFVLEDGGIYRWRRMPRPGASTPAPATFAGPDGRALLEFASELSTQARFRVDVTAAGAGHPRLTLLALVGCYRLLATRRLSAPSPIFTPPLSGDAPLHRS